jgi:hypothetical protein
LEEGGGRSYNQWQAGEKLGSRTLAKWRGFVIDREGRELEKIRKERGCGRVLEKWRGCKR